MTAPPRPASTVVLLRPGDHGIEVCLVRRHDEVAFMGGAHVFPGGRLDPADRLASADASGDTGTAPGEAGGPPGHSAGRQSCCDGVAAALRRLPDLSPADALSHYIGAVRELFEEVGILLAVPADGAPSLDSRRLAAARARLTDGDTTLADLARAEQVRLDLAALVPFGHWVTPESEAKRYDVRFFMATAPTGQAAAHDTHETTEAVWLQPTDALNRCRRGDLLFAPPTWTTLRWLERFASLDDALAWAAEPHDWVVQPRLFDVDGTRMLALPGDPLYPPVEGFAAVETRFLFGDGRWRAIEA